MFRIAIVEDDAHDLAHVKKYLNQYGKEKNVEFNIIEFRDGDNITADYTADYDIILMDIRLGFMDGMKTAEIIRKMDRDVVLIFITNTPQYAIQGYKVNALDYILKPISYFSFSESMNRAIKKVRDEKKDTVIISTKGGKTKLEVNQICYVEVRDHILEYHTADEIYQAKGTLHDAEIQLDPKIFFPCSRSYLINLDYVERYEGIFVYVNGDAIQISRRMRKLFLDALNRHMNGDDR